MYAPQRDDGDMRGPGSARPRSGYARPRPSEAFEKRADKRQKGLDMFYSSLASKDLPCPHFIDKAGKVLHEEILPIPLLQKGD